MIHVHTPQLPNNSYLMNLKDLILQICIPDPLLLTIMAKLIPSKKLTYPIPRLKMIFLFPRWDMLVSWRVNLHMFMFVSCDLEDKLSTQCRSCPKIHHDTIPSRSACFFPQKHPPTPQKRTSENVSPLKKNLEMKSKHVKDTNQPI